MKKKLREQIRDLMMEEFREAVCCIYEYATNYDNDGWIITPTSDEKQLPLYMNDPNNPFNCLFAKWRLKGQSFYDSASRLEFVEVLTRYYQECHPEDILNTQHEQGRMQSIAITLKKLRYAKERALVSAWALTDFT